ncbi:MAG: serine/threonine-protein kinase [Candidatus Gracilibacteria bacterium]|nr:serine/threonine-protein kinase [Candidatus Gracilibacteria bacterium]
MEKNFPSNEIDETDHSVVLKDYELETQLPIGLMKSGVHPQESTKEVFVADLNDMSVAYPTSWDGDISEKIRHFSVAPGEIVMMPSLSVQQALRELSPEADAILRNTRIKTAEILGLNRLTGHLGDEYSTGNILQDILRKTTERMPFYKDFAKIIDQRSPYEEGVVKIGNGGFGDVYLATDRVSKREVVLKLVKPLSEKSISRLKNEMLVLSGIHTKSKLEGFTLRRVGVDGVRGIPDSAGKMLIETEFIDGVDLLEMKAFERDFYEDIQYMDPTRYDVYKSEFPINFRFSSDDKESINTCYLPSHGKYYADVDEDALLSKEDVEVLMKHIEQEISLKNTIDILSQSCEAIDQAHKAGVLHRDIKPQNIMVSKAGDVTIIDWGLVKLMHEDQEMSGQSTQGMKNFIPGLSTGKYSLGTPGYMAPELFDFENLCPESYSIQSDVWAMGVTIVETIMGEAPFKSKNIDDLMSKVRNFDENGFQKIKESLKDTPILWWIIERALETDKADRFESMAEMRFCLDIANGLQNKDAFSQFLKSYIDESVQIKKNPRKKEELKNSITKILTSMQALEEGEGEGEGEGGESRLDEMMKKGEESIILATELAALDKNEKKI